MGNRSLFASISECLLPFSTCSPHFLADVPTLAAARGATVLVRLEAERTVAFPLQTLVSREFALPRFFKRMID